MNIFPDTGRVRLMAVACGLMLLSACATSTSVSPESQVEERATARWEALFSGDLAGAYEYLTPAYRTSVSSLTYQRSVLRKRVAWTSSKYVESVCEESLCKVKFDVGYAIHGALPGVKSFEGTQIIEESWVLIDGQWYFVTPD
jgi:hypothetical protein